MDHVILVSTNCSYYVILIYCQCHVYSWFVLYPIILCLETFKLILLPFHGLKFKMEEQRFVREKELVS